MPTIKEAEAKYEAEQKAKQAAAYDAFGAPSLGNAAVAEKPGGEGIEPEGSYDDVQKACVSFHQLDQNARRNMLLAHAKTILKMSRADAIMTVALGKLETRWDVLFSSGSVHHNLSPSDFPRCPCVTSLGWEGGGGIHWSTWNDSAAKQTLMTFDAVGDAAPPGSEYAMLWKKKPGLQDPWLHALFQEALLTRQRLITRYFSIGMNQILLANARDELAPPGSNQTPGTPHTWDALFRFYTAGAGVMGTQLAHILGWTWNFMVEGRAIDPNASDEITIKWLDKQAGQKYAKDYYYGTGLWANTGGGFKAARDETRAYHDAVYP